MIMAATCRLFVISLSEHMDVHPKNPEQSPNFASFGLNNSQEFDTTSCVES